MAADGRADDRHYVFGGAYLPTEGGPEPLVLALAGGRGPSRQAVVRPSGPVPRAVARELLLTEAEVRRGLDRDGALEALFEGIAEDAVVLCFGEPSSFLARLRRWLAHRHPTAAVVDATSAVEVAWPSAVGGDARSACRAAGVEPGALRGPRSRAEALLQCLPPLRAALRDVPPEVLAECYHHRDLLEWPSASAFGDAPREAAAAIPPHVAPAALEAAFARVPKPQRPPRPVAGLVPGAAAAKATLGPSGPLARAMGNYEDRPRQAEMSASVAEALDRDEVLLVEAGTGIGKSLAYLVPLAMHVLATGERAAVTTATKALQEQLITKDLPLLRAALGADVRATVMKGRANYLCVRRLLEAYRAAREAWVLGDRASLLALLSWAIRSPLMDLSELDWGAERDEPIPLAHLAADGDSCTGAACPVRRACAVQRVRAVAAASDLVIMNHALFFSGQAAGIIPECSRMVIDEAHTLEDVATEQFAASVSGDAFQRLALRAHHPGTDSGLVEAAGAVVESATPPPDDGAVLLHSARVAVTHVHDAARGVERALAELMGAASSAEAGSPKVRVTDAVTRLDRWLPFAETVAAGCESLTRLAESLEGLAALLPSLGSPATHEAVTGLARELAQLAYEMRDFARTAEQVVALDYPGAVFYLERGGPTSASLQAAPIDVGSALVDTIYSRHATVILTSATLSTGDDMSYFVRRLGLEAVSERLVRAQFPSEFDYPRQAVVCIPTDLPDPRDPEWVDSVARAVVDLVRATRGRALVLFTSRAHLEQVHGLAGPPIRALGITVFSQLEASSAGTARRDFEEDVDSVLFATRGFFAGVDIPGPSLECVILTRLPFAVPTDPIVEARRERVAELGGDPMEDYYLPQAVVTFRQALGRLIRSRSDRGCMAVLDPRIIRMRYGKRFRDALPQCRVIQRPTEEAAAMLMDWFAGGPG